MEDEFVGAVALASAKSPRNRRSHTRAHPAVGGLQNEHHKWKSERGAGEGVGADATKEEAVEDDDANEREQIQYVRCCEPQQRGRIGPSSSSFVRAAAAGLGVLVGADSGAGVMVRALMGAPPA